MVSDMKLKHITFTGIDAKTDIQDLIDIQREYPILEFGVLMSYHWYENGNRYLNPQLLGNLWGQSLNLALHVCGRAASDASDGFWNRINLHLAGNLGLFKRVQVNIAGRTDVPYRLASPPTVHTEVIIQQKGINDIEFFERSKWMNTSVLLDASGGRGIDTPIEILPNLLHGGISDYKVGYAGGINPDNVAEKLTFLMENEQVGDFWIDMESGVRTDDWFDTTKVRQVLTICREVINDHSKNVSVIVK